MKIFLSAVSGQFKEARNELASDLRANEIIVFIQEDFQLHDSTLLEKLENLVDRSDRVIAIIGNAYGAEPPVTARPAGFPRRSYTQWEYYFALGERLDGSKARPKQITLCFADNTYLARQPFDPSKQDAEQTALQEQFRQEIRDGNKDRLTFDTVDKLCRLLAWRAHFEFKDPHKVKPRNLPFGTLGHLFKGREPFLNDLRQRLTGSTGGPVAIVTQQAIHGLGGVGKTRTALEYAWRFEADYSALLFVSAPDPAALRTNLANLVGVLAVDLDAMAPEEQRLAEVLAWLHRNPRWLLIFDNVDTPEAAREVRDLLAKLSGGDLLITSRISNWPAGVVPLELHVLEEKHAVEFLLERTTRRRVKPDDPEIAARIARDLDGLALALEQAGAYIDTLRMSLAEYRTKWEQSRLKVLGWHSQKVMTYPASVAVTWLTSFEKLGEPERRLLQILARMAPEPIPLTFFDAKPLKAAIEEPREALAGLADYSLVRFADDGEAIKVHRLVQEIARSRATEDERVESLRVAVESLNDLAPEYTEDVRTWPIWLPLAPHADAVIWEADKCGIANTTARLMNQHAVFLATRGQFATAEPLYKRALAIREASFGPDHPDVATSLNNLAGLMRATNRLADAEPLYKRGLAIFEASFGPDHPYVATSLNNLAGLMEATNRLADAEPFYKRALAIDEASYGPDHPEVATDLNNLAGLMEATNRLADAEPLYKRGLAIFEASFGPDHPYVATSLNNLAGLMRATNRLADAEPLYKRALAIREASFGLDHPDVATSLNNLAGLMEATNRLADAEPFYKRALAIDEASYGPDHPEVAIDLNNLAGLMEATNRLADAEPLYKRGLAIFEASFGPDHPYVATSLNNLAGLMRATNRLADAEPLYKRGLAILIDFQRQTTHEHPKFPAILENYRGFLKRLGLTSDQIEQRIAELSVSPGKTNALS